mmetsp:Transcript_51960/g.130560  ORF Transcript_51960/g.130560 Transcript_51960/m.130560 type:complete len:130 (-) Transcript_51960:176-565(-)
MQDDTHRTTSHRPPTGINQPPCTHKKAKMTDRMGTAGLSVCLSGVMTCVWVWMGNECETHTAVSVCMWVCVCGSTNSSRMDGWMDERTYTECGPSVGLSAGTHTHRDGERERGKTDSQTDRQTNTAASH